MTDRAPDLLGEVVAWRAWKVIGNERLPLLSSVTHGRCIWHPDRWTFALCGNRTECSRSLDGRTPGESCSCGMYAAQTRQQLVSLGYNRYSDAQVVFVGEVGLVGKVIPGSQGWRAERGRIRRLFVPWEHYRFVEGLERLYRVPVQLDNTFNVEPSVDFEKPSALDQAIRKLKGEL